MRLKIPSPKLQTSQHKRCLVWVKILALPYAGLEMSLGSFRETLLHTQS